jgi:hypothetical protein
MSLFSFSDREQSYTAQLNNGTRWTGNANNLNHALQQAQRHGSVRSVDTTARMDQNRR